MPAEAEKLPRQNKVGHQLYQQTYMEGRLFIGGSKTSTFAGGLLFMEGAVYSANTIAKYIYIYSDKLWLHWMVFELFFYNVTIKYISKIPDGQYLAE